VCIYETDVTPNVPQTPSDVTQNELHSTAVSHKYSDFTQNEPQIPSDVTQNEPHGAAVSQESSDITQNESKIVMRHGNKGVTASVSSKKAGRIL
jgi:hypothetical protein